MKLQYLPDGSPDSPLIRLYDFQPAEAARLKELFDSLANGSRTSAPLHEQIGIESVDACHLDLRLGAQDVGIVQKGALTFECALTAEGWSEVASFVEPFCEAAEAQTYQWLNQDGKISFLLSPSGKW
jgi:hypothetical protein